MDLDLHVWMLLCPNCVHCRLRVVMMISCQRFQSPADARYEVRERQLPLKKCPGPDKCAHVLKGLGEYGASDGAGCQGRPLGRRHRSSLIRPACWGRRRCSTRSVSNGTKCGRRGQGTTLKLCGPGPTCGSPWPGTAREQGCSRGCLRGRASGNGSHRHVEAGAARRARRCGPRGA